ncbi:MAG: tRNA 2-thiouridine(34) synthase MnmA, partial [Desulfobulbaceae bacterium]|nr:tRNA 2-thiouridine(34) synthase MnmA [Desulfobulbaceae bacterium]
MTTAAKTAAVAMSGGVDSSVVAAILMQQGYAVRGLFMAFGQPGLAAQIERVRKVAAALGVELEVIDVEEAFRAKVLAYFRDTYLAGRTPNPCVLCNPEVKFGRLLAAARDLGADLLATGHYARLEREGGRVRLLKGLDPQKDQSYFLHRLRQEQLGSLLFPLGGFTKGYVRELAAGFGIAGVHGAESQDVCFLQGTTVVDFLEAQGPTPAGGEIVRQDGAVVGRHQGIHRYTIGQRRGLGIPDATPYYVVGLDAAGSRVLVGKDEELWQDHLSLRDVVWVGGEPPSMPARLTVKIRYRHAGAPASIEPHSAGGLVVRFDTR